MVVPFIEGHVGGPSVGVAVAVEVVVGGPLP